MSDEEILVDHAVDASGLKCPLPILYAKKALNGLQSGQVLKVVSTDSGSARDFEAFCRQTGNALLRVEAETGRWSFYLRRR